MPSVQSGTLGLAAPDISDLEKQYVNEVLESGRLALGPKLERFEQLMADACGTQHAVGVSSGTAALHCIVGGLGLGDGDEIITTPFSFIASANAALFENARPRFVDVDPLNYNIDPHRIEDAITERTAAILAVDVFGQPADWPALTAIAKDHDLHLIDDGCEALGASVDGQPVGSWGNATAFGFYPNKQITTGEGGCITTDDANLAETCRSLRNQGRAATHRMEHTRLGYNYRLDELSAALGCAQLERLPELLASRSKVAHWYLEHLGELDGDLHLPHTNPDSTRSWFVFVVRLADHFAPSARNILSDKLQEKGIASAPYFPAIHLQPYYRERFGYERGDFPICEKTADRTLALPFHNDLSEGDVVRVKNALKHHLPQLPRG